MPRGTTLLPAIVLGEWSDMQRKRFLTALPAVAVVVAGLATGASSGGTGTAQPIPASQLRVVVNADGANAVTLPRLHKEREWDPVALAAAKRSAASYAAAKRAGSPTPKAVSVAAATPTPVTGRTWEGQSDANSQPSD